MNQKQKVALVLSGGGARGIAHLGVIEVLEENEFEISSIAGTSMGAMVGGVYAIGKATEFKNWLFTLDKIKVFQLLDFTFSSQGLIKGDKVLDTLKEFIQDINIEDLKIPFSITATDIVNRKEVVFTTGSFYDAVRASIAIPSVFTPVKTDNGLLVDGGILNNIPINNVKRNPNDILIAVNVNADVPEYKPPVHEQEKKAIESVYHKKIANFQNQLKKMMPVDHSDKLGYFRLIEKTIHLMMYRITQTSLEQYSPDMLINVSQDTCSIFDYYKAEELVEAGRHEAMESIKAYKNGLQS